MPVLQISGFQGANQATNAKMLPPSVGVSDINHDPRNTDLRPIAAALQVATVPAGTKTIYRMGRDTASDTQYWLSWNSIVHAVRGFVATDTTERTYYTGDGFPKWTDNIKALAAQPYPNAWRQLGVPAPTSAPVLSAAGGSSTSTETLFAVYTYVTDAGEEGPPSPVSAQLDCKTDDTITINGFAALPAGSFGITSIRIYFTQSGSSGATFQFQQEISATAASATYAQGAASLGEALQTTDWIGPPADLSYLTGMWNGMMAGISGRAVCLCVPYVPYAWPIAFQQTYADVSPVALATFEQNLLVLTTGSPIVLSGGDPSSLDQLPLDFDRPCIGPQSPVSIGRGVVWACPDGLAYYGSTEKEGQVAYQFRLGGLMLTKNLLTREQWQALNPASMVGVRWLEDFVLFFYQDPTSGLWNGLMINPSSPGGLGQPVQQNTNAGLYFFDFGFEAVWRDPLDGIVYTLDSTGAISKWGYGAAKTATFLSKVFHQPMPTVGFARGKVVADAYPVNVTLIADGVQVFSEDIPDGEMFTLPGDYYANDYQVKIVTSNPVVGVVFTHSEEEMEEVG